jgi:mono/diheme cytochrome c family protein
MAATDQNYRNQKTLDIIFAVTCILMLISVIWMFADDYNRPFKVEQRNFRDVEYQMSERAYLDLLPHDKLRAVVEAQSPDEKTAAVEDVNKWLDQFSDAEKAVADAREKFNEVKADPKIADAIHKAQIAYANADAKQKAVKADYDSKESLYYIAVDDRDAATGPRKETLAREVTAQKTALDNLKAQLTAARDDLERKKTELDEALKPQADKEQKLTAAEANLNRLRNKIDVADKLAKQKQWSLGDSIRAWPILDGFASPYRIQQYTLEALPIDYNFKYVTRYDRCATCHLGLEKPAYTDGALARLRTKDEGLQKRVDAFRKVLEQRKAEGKGLGGFKLEDLPQTVSTLPETQLTTARVKQFAAHPRLDLFVDGNSPHPAEKFGCTICHGGQGSATDFFNASHSPDDETQKKLWQKAPSAGGHDWTSNHYWDYPMHPKRFTESSCLQCHHQVTDLVRYGNKEEAPKLLRGYYLVKEFGCFGCHEIPGLKGGRTVGPDLRLEPNVPLDAMSPDERAKVESDPLNPPGTIRRAGPSLYRLAEKTNEAWVRKWIRSPRGFRPDTRMPHFYGLSNNNQEVLTAHDKDKKPDDTEADIPDAEIRAIAHYLMRESEGYLKGNDVYKRTNEARRKQLETREAGTLSEAEKTELKETIHKLESMATTAPALELRGKDRRPIQQQITDSEGKVVTLPEEPKDGKDRSAHEKNGRKLFTERGCLACHTHSGTEANGGIKVAGEAVFGPNLSELAAKLGTKPGDKESARRWLVQWILNPNIHFPRTRMPITFLNEQEAGDVALWLLAQKPTWEAEDIPDPSLDTLKKLARVYLKRIRTKEEVDDLLKSDSDDKAKERVGVWLGKIRADSDEAVFLDARGRPQVTADALKLYTGKKAISRMGCFGCHAISGFESAKPIGTQLNDWGKKDAERLAFEDALSYVEEHHYEADKLTDKDGKPLPIKEEKEGDKTVKKSPYETYFLEALKHHKREGFLHQKLAEPRSYDYHRDRAWDDRLRMPQFRFARSRKLEDEDDAAYEARQHKEEAEAREAVMTFILGLIAEPVPAQYVAAPPPDRLAEIKGRTILDKFNCAGCHQLKAGVYEFKLTDDVRQKLADMYKEYESKSKKEGEVALELHKLHNAWTGLPAPWPDRLLAHGTNREDAEDGKSFTIRLSEALQLPPDKDKKDKDVVPPSLPASTSLSINRDDLIGKPSNSLGGLLVELLGKPDENGSSYMKKAVSPDYRTLDDAKADLPPPLLREGERVQPGWLFQFLRNPYRIRPQVILRMPKFNMSEDDARNLVNYFNGGDRTGNPNYGLVYPYTTVKQQQDEFWRERASAYKKRLGKEEMEARLRRMEPLWEMAVKDDLSEAERRLEFTREALRAAQKAEAEAPASQKADAKASVQTLEGNIKDLEKRVQDLKDRVQKKDFSELRKQWEDTGVYATDAYRMVANPKSICLTCHQMGNGGPAKPQGPPLDAVASRLRPEWTELWTGDPVKMFPYTNKMPPNFRRGNEGLFKSHLDGTIREQLEAARDVLIGYPKVMSMPENRYFGAAPGGGK